jgi:hypothetical protein
MDMKILIILLFFVLFAGLLTEYSYAETNKEKNNDNVKIFIQIVLRNSDGTLVGYIEGIPQEIYNIDQVIDWMEPQANKSIIIKDGKKFEMLQFKDKFSYSKTKTIGGYRLDIPINDKTVHGLYFFYDSIYVSPDDTAQIFWTAIIPLN